MYCLFKAGCWIRVEAEEVSIADQEGCCKADQDRPRAAVEEVSYAANPADADTAPTMREIIFQVG